MPGRRVAEALTDDVVDVDVGAAEAINRLLRIADDEQRAGTEWDGAPVDRFGIGPAKAGPYGLCECGCRGPARPHGPAKAGHYSRTDRGHGWGRD